ENKESLYDALARTGANYLQDILSKGVNVGVGLSKTLYYLQKYIVPDGNLEANFYSLTGGLTQVPDEYEHTNVIANLASAFGGTAYSILAPIFVSGPDVKAMLSQEKSIESILNKAKNCDLAITSVGTHEKNSVLFRYTPLNFEEEVDLILNKAVGDVLGRFYNIQGEEIQSKLSEITIGLSIAELKEIPTVILIAGGERKLAAIQGALHGHIADVLITNKSCSEKLLEQ
ncbi:MAG: sugar-binding transcriptional regulator, partial [Anaerolineales bacterium]